MAKKMAMGAGRQLLLDGSVLLCTWWWTCVLHCCSVEPTFARYNFWSCYTYNSSYIQGLEYDKYKIVPTSKKQIKWYKHIESLITLDVEYPWWILFHIYAMSTYLKVGVHHRRLFPSVCFLYTTCKKKCEELNCISID